ncbi:HAMP domain-containing sensor histidine kinase [uncultured Ruminococcus sp.]|uniref:HAMP domain-containing sensor histidine kinase n=1 Tax=uncultured Ruminococcus sp. TaxID=165186 RepID=UPI002625BF7D|nr:HAMP domain-containing sensor histidine kinase [uncultured Ruminococcus sp.]
MKRRYVIIYIVFFSLMSAIMCMAVMRDDSAAMPQYTTEINRLLISIGEDWEDISSREGVYGSSGEKFDYAVTDNDGRLLFCTKKGMSESVSAATGSYDIIRDIESGGQVVGKLIVHNDYPELRRRSARRNAVMTGGMAAAMLAVSVGYFIFLRRRVIVPFAKLKGFAARMAAGDLETPLEMDRGNIFGAFTESFDIMREELKASRKREEAAVNSRKELIAELSHDIRTPVSSIKAMTDYLELVSEDSEQKETLSAINGKADQIDRLVSNLFHAALEELEQLEVSPEELASTGLERIIADSDPLRKVKSSDIKECVIYADRLRLEQVVGNIISNSYKYADTDITVTSFIEDGFFVAEISDRGGGVPDDELELITEKFRRGSNAAGKDGSGIGLYISGYLMDKMGGELLCRNNGEGFTVSLRLRLV